MKIKQLKEVLNMFQEDCEIYIRTNENDFSTPLDQKRISVGIIEKQDKPTIFFTAYIPIKED